MCRATINDIKYAAYAMRMFRKDSRNQVALKELLLTLNKLLLDGKVFEEIIISMNHEAKFYYGTPQVAIKNVLESNKGLFMSFEMPICKPFSDISSVQNFIFRHKDINKYRISMYPIEKEKVLYFNEVFYTTSINELNRDELVVEVKEISASEWVNTPCLFINSGHGIVGISPFKAVEILAITEFHSNEINEEDDKLLTFFKGFYVDGIPFMVFLYEYITSVITSKIGSYDLSTPDTPTFYRIMDEVYCKSFVNDGKLRITGLGKIRQYDNNYQGDINDGITKRFAKGPEGMSVNVNMSYDNPFFILCGSYELTEKTISDWNGTHAIAIHDIIRFVDDILMNNEVGICLGGVCEYIDEISRYHDSALSTVDISEKGTLIFTFGNNKKHEPLTFDNRDLLLKHTFYAYQNEYRVIVTSKVESDYLNIQTTSQNDYSEVVKLSR